MERLLACYRVLVLAILLLSLGCMRGEVSGQPEGKALIANQFEKWQKGEVNFFDLLAEDVTWEVSGKSLSRGFITARMIF